MFGKLSRRARKKLEEHGRRAPAVVVEIADSGMSISSGQLVSGTELVLKTKLRVQPSDEPEFEVEQRFRYPQLSIPSVGTRLGVIYDPSDHDKIMIDRSAGGTMMQFTDVTALQGTGLESLANTVQQAEAQTNDPQELARILQQQLGAPVSVDQQGSSGVTFGAPTGGFGASASPDEDPVDKLAKLAELKEKGLLTDAEFEAQKARILGEG
jgi:hypothetical protein